MSNYHISDFNSFDQGSDNATEDNFTVETLERPKEKEKTKTINESFQSFEEEVDSPEGDFNSMEENFDSSEEGFNSFEEDLNSPEEYETFDGDTLLADESKVMLRENKVAIPPMEDNIVPPPMARKPFFDGLPRIPITIGKKKKERKVVKKEYTSLQAKNSNFIFVFGYTGSGKTTVLAAIDLYIRRRYAKTVNPTGNKVGINHINKIVRNITFGEFPNATTAGTIVEYDVALTHPVSDETINLTFIEMAGEDLRRINTDDEDGGVGDLRSEIKKYLTCPDISMSFLLIADYKERVESLREDDLFMNFFGYLRNLEVPLENVGVIVSKFDKDQTDRLFLSDVVEDYLPQTRRFMENKSIVENAKIFPFSIGTVVQEEGDEPRIEAIDLRDTDAIVNWLFDSFSDFTGRTSWSWKKFLDF